MKKKINLIITIIFIVACTLNVYADVVIKASDCNSSLMQTLHDDVFKPIQIFVPILFVVLTSVDFAKAVFASDDKEGINKAKSNFVKRGVAVLIVFFAPLIIIAILSLVGEENNIGACISKYWI